MYICTTYIQIKMNKTKGLIAAVFTPFKTDGSPNAELIPGIVNKLVDEGITGIFICGTNGEGLNMTIEERMDVAEMFVAAAEGRIRTVVHIGHNAISESKKLAAHAAYIGADAISAVASFYFKPASLTNLVDCVAEIARAAPDLPFYYYHMPTITGLSFKMPEFLKAAKKRIPNLAGIKYTASTLNEFQLCLDYNNGSFDVLSGFDEMLLSALVVGAYGAVGSTYNFALPVYLDIVKQFKTGNLPAARKLQAKMVEMIGVLFEFSPIPAQRAIMKMIGFDLGPCRLPLNDLTEAEFRQLQRKLDKIDFFKLLKQYEKKHAPVA